MSSRELYLPATGCARALWLNGSGDSGSVPRKSPRCMDGLWALRRAAAELIFSAGNCLVTMSSNLAHAPVPQVRVRKAERADLDALMALEHRVFASDRLSRRSLRRLLASPSADVLVAQEGDHLA